MSDLYYIQNKNAGYLGNSPTWYAKNGQGYTAYIAGAEVFTKEEADKMEAEDPDKWRAFPKAEIDKRLHLVYDSQDNRNLGTDAPCGWSSGYTPMPAPNTLVITRDELLGMRLVMSQCSTKEYCDARNALIDELLERIEG